MTGTFELGGRAAGDLHGRLLDRELRREGADREGRGEGRRELDFTFTR